MWFAVTVVISQLVASHPRAGMASGNIRGAHYERRDTGRCRPEVALELERVLCGGTVGCVRVVGEIRFEMMEPERNGENTVLTIKCITSETSVLVNPYSERKCNPVADKDSPRPNLSQAPLDSSQVALMFGPPSSSRHCSILARILLSQFNQNPPRSIADHPYPPPTASPQVITGHLGLPSVRNPEVSLARIPPYPRCFL